MHSRQYQNQLTNPSQHIARVKLGIAVANGQVDRPQCCSRCGDQAKRIEGHHPNYDEPLAVIWVCPPCHSVIHPHIRQKTPPQYVLCIECRGEILKKRRQATCFHCRHTTKLTCHACNQEFRISNSDYQTRLRRRSQQYKSQWFCSKSCFSKEVAQEYGWQGPKGYWQNRLTSRS